MNGYLEKFGEGENALGAFRKTAPHPTLMLRKMRNMSQAKVFADQWAQGLVVFWDAVEMVSPVIVQELLPDGCTPQTPIDDTEIGDAYRERIAQIAVNKWSHQRIMKIHMEAIDAAVEYMQEAILSEGLNYTLMANDLKRSLIQSLRGEME